MSDRRIAPALDVAPSPRTSDKIRCVWWLQLGFLHGITKGRGRARVLSALLALGWWVALPLVVVIQPALMSRRHVRYYMSANRDAVLAIVAKAAGWHAGEHFSSKPGTGQGAALRVAVLPPLMRAADEQHIELRTTAATRALAQQYMSELPGLERDGPAWPRGYKLRRYPVPRN